MESGVDDVVAALTGEFKIGQRVQIRADDVVVDCRGQYGTVDRIEILGVEGDIWYGVVVDSEGAYLGRAFKAESLVPIDDEDG